MENKPPVNSHLIKAPQAETSAVGGTGFGRLQSITIHEPASKPGLFCLSILFQPNMMTSSNKNIFGVTGPLCEEFTGDRWIPHTKASDAEIWCFLWSTHEQTTEQTIARQAIWDVIVLIMTSP